MKSAKSFFNKEILKDLLRRHWWFGFINLIVLFFAIPINYLVSIQRFTYPRYQNMELALAELQKYTTSFFSLAMDGTLIVTALVTMLSALLAGLVFFAYLQRKDQVNFFHSQPVSRECLFTNRILAGILLFALPYIINLIIVLIITGLNGLIALVSLTGLLAQIGFVLLMFAVIFALVVFAGILCGTMFAQVQILVLIMFAPLLVYSSLLLLCQRFYSTFYADYYLQKMIYFSPVTHLIALLSSEAKLHAGIIIIYLLLMIAVLAAALWLYLRRPSEGAGITLVFPISRPLVKYISCFIAAILLGMFFDQLAGFYFMIFGMVAGALLCSFFVEAQIYRDFKAMFKNLKGLAVFGAGVALLVGAIAFDITGYDKYLPDENKVQAVSFSWDDQDIRPIFNNQRHYPQDDLKHLTYTSPEVKTDLIKIIDISLDQGTYVKKARFSKNSQISTVGGPIDYGTNKRTLTVVYQMDNGRKIPRRYNALDLTPVKDQVQNIISSQEYKSKHSIMAIADAHLPTNVNIEPIDRGMDDYRVAKMVTQDQIKDRLIKAIKTDVQMVGETIDNPVVYYISCDDREYNARINIYENYTNSLQVIKEISSATDLVVVNPEWSNVTRLEVRKLGSTTGQPLIITNPEQIKELFKLTRSHWGGSMTLFDQYTVSVPATVDDREIYNEPYTKEMAIKAEMAKEVRFFVIGKVPGYIKAELN